MDTACNLLLPGSLLVGPGEGGGGASRLLGELDGLGALESIRDFVEESVANAIHGCVCVCVCVCVYVYM